MLTESQRVILDKAASYLRGRPIVVLTGAGISTDSGIPDYRGPTGSLRKRSPIQYRQFVTSEEDRRSYWARSAIGWPRAAAARPNSGHYALAAMEAAGVSRGIITQNVDGLHTEAGSSRVIELHGRLRSVKCLDCGNVESRDSVQRRISHLNPGWTERQAELAPDGDAELPRELTSSFVTPHCVVCGGVLKPDVVFFGENVEPLTVRAAFDLLDQGEGLLVVGTSLAVYSGLRFLDRAVRRAIPAVILNQGPVRGSEKATLHLEVPISDSLPFLAAKLTNEKANLLVD